MKSINKKQFLTIAMTLFSLFFGAGNFIFPPTVGANSGENFFVGVMFFCLAAVALPILGVAAVAKSGSLRALADRVDRFSGFIFTLSAYIALGPLLAIPRAGSMPFEIALSPLVPNENHGIFLAVYAFLYFIINAYMCLSESRLFNIIGRYLTPIMLVLIFALFFVGINKFSYSFNVPVGGYLNSPAASGFVDGYQTMDALAALIFATLITGVLKGAGINDKRVLVSSTIKAGLFAGIILMCVYFMLAMLGALNTTLNITQPAKLLSDISLNVFGVSGQIVLGIAFFLACFGTTTGLTSAVSRYFNSIMPYISYRVFVFIFSISSAFVACLGLNQILAISVPILVALYPIAIVLIVLSLIDELIDSSTIIYRSCAYVSGIVGIISALDMIKFPLGYIGELVSKLPFFDSSLGWIVPVSIAFAFSYIFHIIFSKTVRY